MSPPGRWFPAGAESVFSDPAAAVLVTDPAGLVTPWSPGAQALWGHAPEQVTDTPVASPFTSDATAPRHRDGETVDASALPAPPAGAQRGTEFLVQAVPEEGVAGEQPFRR